MPDENTKTTPSDEGGSALPTAKKRPKRRRPSRKRRKPGRTKQEPESSPSVQEREDDWDVSQFDVPAKEGLLRFTDFDIPQSLLHAVFDLGFQYCTPIQADVLPHTLSGKDAGGRAQTGTGKTAAFLITVATRLLKAPIQGKRKSGTPRVLIIAPTRELVLQISEEARQIYRYTPLKVLSVFGGMDYNKQRNQLNNNHVDIIVATPGRLLDFQRRRDISLKEVEILIIDEADRMLDMGFIPDVRKIIYSTPAKDKRQTLLFSATLDERITRLASSWMRNPVIVEIEPQQIAVDTVEQIVYIVTTDEKFSLIFNIIDKQNLERVLVFCNRKDEVRRLSETFTRHGIQCDLISGDVPQKKRIRRLELFKKGKIRVLVATDVAGRGIHIEDMDHVINFTLPRDPEDYVHRIGRTGRAGSAGTSISFADEEDAFYIPAIEKFMGRELQCIRPEDDWLDMPTPLMPKKKAGPRRRSKGKPGKRAAKRSSYRPKRSRPAPKRRPSKTASGKNRDA